MAAAAPSGPLHHHRHVTTNHGLHGFPQTYLPWVSRKAVAICFQLLGEVVLNQPHHLQLRVIISSIPSTHIPSCQPRIDSPKLQHCSLLLST